MEKRLEGKVAVITGAGRGIARGVAHHFGMHGAKVVCVDYGVDVEGGNPRSEIAEQTAAEIRANGGEAIGGFGDASHWAHPARPPTPPPRRASSASPIPAPTPSCATASPPTPSPPAPPPV